jgi:hypothetical protein
VLDLVLGNRNARKLRDAADRFGIDGHGMLLSRPGSRAYSRVAFAAATLSLLRGAREASI